MAATQGLTVYQESLSFGRKPVVDVWVSGLSQGEASRWAIERTVAELPGNTSCETLLAMLFVG